MFVDYAHPYLAPRPNPRPGPTPMRRRRKVAPGRRSRVPIRVPLKRTNPGLPKKVGMSPRTPMKTFIPAVKYAKPLFRLAGKLNPYTGALSYAWDAYDWYQDWKAAEWAKTRAGGIDLTDWTLCCDTGLTPLQKFSVTRGRPSAGQWPNFQTNPCYSVGYPLNCGLGGQVPNGDYADVATYTFTPFASRTLFDLRFGPATSGGTRMTFAQVWRLATDNPNPFELPLTQPVVQPLPQPEYDWPPFPEIYPVNNPLPRQHPFPVRHPAYSVPGIQFEPQPDGWAWRAVRHLNLPPPPSVKEEKGLVAKSGYAGQVFGGTFGAMTEALDAVNAVYESIPGAPKGMTYNEKLTYIAKNWRNINGYAAVRAIAWDQIQDRIIAKGNKLLNSPFVGDGRAAKYWKSPTGVGGRWTRPPGISAKRTVRVNIVK